MSDASRSSKDVRIESLKAGGALERWAADEIERLRQALGARVAQCERFDELCEDTARTFIAAGRKLERAAAQERAGQPVETAALPPISREVYDRRGDRISELMSVLAELYRDWLTKSLSGDGCSLGKKVRAALRASEKANECAHALAYGGDCADHCWCHSQHAEKTSPLRCVLVPENLCSATPENPECLCKLPDPRSADEDHDFPPNEAAMIRDNGDAP